MNAHSHKDKVNFDQCRQQGMITLAKSFIHKIDSTTNTVFHCSKCKCTAFNHPENHHRQRKAEHHRTQRDTDVEPSLNFQDPRVRLSKQMNSVSTVLEVTVCVPTASSCSVHQGRHGREGGREGGP
eukprot:251171-Hanusia_phi.AAC.1